MIAAKTLHVGDNWFRLFLSLCCENAQMESLEQMNVKFSCESDEDNFFVFMRDLKNSNTFVAKLDNNDSEKRKYWKMLDKPSAFECKTGEEERLIFDTEALTTLPALKMFNVLNLCSHLKIGQPYYCTDDKWRRCILATEKDGAVFERTICTEDYDTVLWKVLSDIASGAYKDYRVKLNGKERHLEVGYRFCEEQKIVSISLFPRHDGKAKKCIIM